MLVGAGRLMDAAGQRCGSADDHADVRLARY